MQEQFLQVDVPAIVSRLAGLFGLRSDAEISRWLDRADNYISLAKKRGVIDVGPILARVPPSNWAYVLLQADVPGSTPVPRTAAEPVDPALVEKALPILGHPHPEALAKDVGVSPKEMRDWISGKSQPSHAQLVRLFNKVAVASEALATVVHGAASPEKIRKQKPPVAA